MAVGAKGLSYIEGNIEHVSHEITKDIPDRLNTFNYVYNSLDKWADETVVGSTLRGQIKQMITGIEDLSNTTGRILDSLREFVEKQKEINNRE